jgi:hypothetical protein
MNKLDLSKDALFPISSFCCENYAILLLDYKLASKFRVRSAPLEAPAMGLKPAATPMFPVITAVLSFAAASVDFTS